MKEETPAHWSLLLTPPGRDKKGLMVHIKEDPREGGFYFDIKRGYDVALSGSVHDEYDVGYVNGRDVDEFERIASTTDANGVGYLRTQEQVSW